MFVFVCLWCFCCWFLLLFVVGMCAYVAVVVFDAVGVCAAVRHTSHYLRSGSSFCSLVCRGADWMKIEGWYVRVIVFVVFCCCSCGCCSVGCYFVR